MLIWRKKN